MRINAFMRIVPENSAHQCILMRVDNTMSHRQRHVTDVYRMPEAFCKIDAKGIPFETPQGRFTAVAKGIFTRGGICQKTLKRQGCLIPFIRKRICSF